MAESEGLKLFQTLVPLIGLALLIAIGVILMVQQFRRSLFRQRLNQEQLKMKHQRELLRSAIVVQEKERQRIAADLHDELGARLSVALRLLRQASEEAPTSTESPLTYLFQLETHLEQALSSTRRISYELMPPQLVNLGLYRALLVLVEEARQAGNIRVELAKSSGTDKYPWHLQLGLFRMVSELLNNTLKHSGATEAQVELKEEEGWVICSYLDNGRGLAEEQKMTGLGLKSLEGRVAALNGSVEWGNSALGGFFANVRLPVIAGGESS